MSDIDKHGDGDPHIAEFELCHNPEDVLRIGRDFQMQDTFRGAQHDTVKLLCDTIEYLRDRLSKPVCNSAAHAMTLDEAIAHAEDVADRCDTSCGREHRQLADWLKELRDVKSQPVGNAAAMRDALEKIVLAAKVYTEAPDDQYPAVVSGLAATVSKKARAALSAPARNCDLPDARARFSEFCERFRDIEIHCERCPYWNEDDCEAQWLLAPAAERKGSN